MSCQGTGHGEEFRINNPGIEKGCFFRMQPFSIPGFSFQATIAQQAKFFH